MITRSSLTRLALGAAVIAGASTFAQAQENAPLIDALVRKGILSSEEATELRSELSAEAKKAPVYVGPGSNKVSRLALTGRVQAQFNLVNNESDNVDVASTNSRFSLRRVRLGATADFGSDFRGVISYDLVANNLDVAYVRWNESSDLSIDVGFRKVNFGYEENTSSSRLPAIERSPVTRFFVEENNGRRLGGGSRRAGVFADGKAGDLFYGAAVTNLERQANPGTAQIADASQPALWVNGGLRGRKENSTHTVGASLGYLPEQIVAGVLTGGALLVTSVYSDFSFGNAGLVAEVLWSENDSGAGANSWGFHLIPIYDLSKKLQFAGRFSFLDTDGIGTRPGDVVPGAGNPAGNPGFESVTEVYCGLNYFIKGNDVKLSTGLFYARFDDQIGGAGDVSAASVGLRSQMQVNF